MSATRPDFLSDPRVLAGLSGIGSAFSTVANNQMPGATRVDPVQAGVQNFQATQQNLQKEEALKNIQANMQNLPPFKRAAAMAIIQSGDTGAINTLMENLTKPISVGAGSSLIDPVTNKPIYRAPAAAKWSAPQSVVGRDGKTHIIQINEATGQTREVPDYSPANKGTRLSTSADGGVLFEQGTFPTPQDTAGQSGIVQDPTKSPSRGGQGGVYRNTETGESYVTNPATQQQQDVTTMSAIDRAYPQIEEFVDKMPQFQSKWRQGESAAAGFLNRWVPGVDIDLPSQRKEGEAVLNRVPESLLKAFGITSFTEKNVEDFKEVLKSDPDESKEGLKRRIYRFLKELKDQKSVASNRINYGTKLNNANAPATIPTYNPLTKSWS